MLAPSFADLGPIVTGYEAIGDEEEVIPEPRKRAEEKGVYWSFWLLGAGVLLSWNGELSD